MKRLLIRAAAAAALVGLLVACDAFTTSAELQFSMEPTGNLGYEVSSSGEITITSRNLVFRNAAGEYGLALSSYRIEFYDENDDPVLDGDNVQLGTLSVFVPPGIHCDEPDAVLGCTLASEGARFAPGPLVVTEAGYQLLPAGIAQAHLLRTFPELGDDGDFVPQQPQPIGWHADITFFGRTAVGSSYTSPVYRVGIAPPN